MDKDIKKSIRDGMGILNYLMWLQYRDDVHTHVHM